MSSGWVRVRLVSFIFLILVENLPASSLIPKNNDKCQFLIVSIDNSILLFKVSLIINFVRW